MALLGGQLKKSGVKANLDLSPGISLITASPLEFNHVFLNLINNAVEAMSPKSELKGGLMGRTPSGSEITIKTYLQDENIFIKVMDTGPGISKQDLNHIFDPFYTKKRPMGFGVGLSVCHGIIEDHNGSIRAENSPDGGAVFTIKLPAS